MCHQLLRKHMDKGVLLVINTLIVGEQHARVGRHPGDLRTIRLPTGSHVKFLKSCASISLFLYMFFLLKIKRNFQKSQGHSSE